MTTLTSQLGDQLASLTLKEAVALSRYLVKAHDIQPAKPTLVTQPDKRDEKIEPTVKTALTVKLTGVIGKRLSVIKALRQINSLELVAAKAALDELPFTVAVGLTLDEAKALKEQFEAAGAEVEVV